MAHERAWLRWFMLIAVFSVIAVPHAMADGKFYATLRVKDDPTIPSQRAIIIHREGEQTLIVESEIETEADELGWILPLPAAPGEIAPTTPGVLKTMRELVQPKITWRRDTGPLQFIAIYLAVALLLAHAIGATAQSGARRLYFLTALLALLVLGACALLTLATAGNARSLPEVIGVTNAGSYEVTILRGESGASVRQWLEQNGFRCDDESEAVLDAYVRDGWVFAAARLQRSEAGPMSHHPLKITFPADHPVYPMRLTGIGATALQLDLYIFAEQKATARDLDVWQCDRMVRDKNYTNRYVQNPLVYQGERKGFTIGHPEVVTLIWHGCVFTHLRATLPPQALTRDVELTFTDFEPGRKRFFTVTSARQFGTAMGLFAIALVLFVLGIAGLGPLPGSVTTKRNIAGLYALLALAALALPLLLPTVDVTEQRGHRAFISHVAMRMAESLEIGLTDRPDGEPLEVLTEWTSFDAKKHLIDVPGGVTATRLDDGGWEIIAYDQFAAPMRLIVPGMMQE